MVEPERPQAQASFCLAGFAGKSCKGTWTLQIKDAEPKTLAPWFPLPWVYRSRTPTVLPAQE